MRAAVMEGSLAEFDLPSVIQVVSIGRQYTGVELFDDHGASVGTLLLKSGKILAAASGSLSGLDAVLTMLRGREQKRFTVYRTEPLPDTNSPVGSVGEVLLRAMQHEKKSPTRISVMEGTLSDVDLVSVLQVIGIGRQFTSVEIVDPGGRLIGRIEVKAGKVISASTGHLKGMDSMRRLVQSPRDSRFIVYRSSDEPTAAPIGSLSQMLMKLVDTDEGWESLEPNTRAHRTVVDPAASRSGRPPAPIPAAGTPPPPPRAANGVAEVTLPVHPAASPAAAPPPAARQAAMPAPAPQARDGKAEAPAPAAEPFFGEAFTSTRGMVALPVDEVPVVCVTSPKGGSGKTTVALNLSVALARRGRRVVLVDGDHGGVLTALNAQLQSEAGAYDVVDGRARLGDVTIQSRLPGLRIVPSGEGSDAARESAPGWPQLVREARADADIVLVDVAGGMSGLTAAACAACTHALVVLAAEPASLRKLPDHLRRIESLAAKPPRLAGVVLNMLDYRATASLEVLKQLCAGPAARLAFDVPIARSPAFLEAVSRGLPLSRGDNGDAPSVGWVFEMLASSLLERLGVGAAYDNVPLL